MKERAAREVLRKHKLARCKRHEVFLAARMTKMAIETTSIEAKWLETSGPIKLSQDTLGAEIKSYDTKAANHTPRNMIGTE